MLHADLNCVKTHAEVHVQESAANTCRDARCCKCWYDALIENVKQDQKGYRIVFVVNVS